MARRDMTRKVHSRAFAIGLIDDHQVVSNSRVTRAQPRPFVFFLKNKSFVPQNGWVGPRSLPAGSYLP